MRTAGRSASQGRIGVEALQALIGEDVEVEAVTTAQLRTISRQWAAQGLSSASIVVRLNCLSAIGVNVKGCRPRIAKKLKWWLDPESEEKIVAHLMERSEDPTRAYTTPRRVALVHLIMWTTRTGLRIEESLRLTWDKIHRRTIVDAEGNERLRVTVTVPGTKTGMAQATLVLSPAAVEVLDGIKPHPGRPIFDIPYDNAQHHWQRARLCLGLPDPTVATLKALRRSAARHLHSVKGMPLDLVRTYLRHESVNTTMGYLRLTGGYNEEEMARWL
jgi:integrase